MLMEGYQQAAQKLYGNHIRVRVCGIYVEDNKILMICHKPIVGTEDFWYPPGGGVEEGETVQETLKREFLEETGLKIEVGRLRFTNEFIETPVHAIELFFDVNIIGGILKKGNDPELGDSEQLIKGLSWLPLEDNVFSMNNFHSLRNSEK